MDKVGLVGLLDVVGPMNPGQCLSQVTTCYSLLPCMGLVDLVDLGGLKFLEHLVGLVSLLGPVGPVGWGVKLYKHLFKTRPKNEKTA